MKVLIEADGGSRGNPGPAGYGAVVRSADRGVVLAEAKSAIGRATNNVAEYRGLIAGLQEAADVGATEVEAYLDSKLVVEQMAGRWRVKHPDLASLHRQAKDVERMFDRVSYRWIPRADNSHADRLANEAMDAAAQLAESGELPAPVANVATPAVATPAVATPNVAAPDVAAANVAPPKTEATNPAGWTAAQGAPTRFLLLRHGQTELSVQRRYSGRGNPALTDVGIKQAGAAAEYLGNQRDITSVVSSPLQRAYDTASAAAKVLGLDVLVDDDLIETDFGAWEGLSFTEAAQRDPELHASWLRDTSVPPPEGESFDAVASRVRSARRRIIAEHAGQTVLVVSHVTPIKTLLRMALDAGPTILYRLHLDLASLSIAEFYPDGAASVRLVNQTSYL